MPLVVVGLTAIELQQVWDKLNSENPDDKVNFVGTDSDGVEVKINPIFEDHQMRFEIDPRDRPVPLKFATFDETEINFKFQDVDKKDHQFMGQWLEYSLPKPIYFVDDQNWNRSLPKFLNTITGQSSQIKFEPLNRPVVSIPYFVTDTEERLVPAFVDDFGKSSSISFS